MHNLVFIVKDSDISYNPDLLITKLDKKMTSLGLYLTKAPTTVFQIF